MKYAPIAIFAYNRLDVLKKTLKFLKKNLIFNKSKIIFFIDGPKNNKDKKDVNIVREFLLKNSKTINAQIISKKKNIGLTNSITRGLDLIFKTYDKCIILEDDILVSKDFLRVMNFYLNYYKKDKHIASIEGYMYPIKFKKNIPNTFFLKGTGCWGWSTWRRAWIKNKKNKNFLLKKLNNLSQKNIQNFNYFESYNYYKMLKNKNTWAIKWYASNYINNNYTLFFKHSLVKNIGFGKKSTNTTLDYNLNVKKFKKLNYYYKPKTISENIVAKIEISKYLKNTFNYYNKMKLILNKLFHV
jgi:hypothetical protein